MAIAVHNAVRAGYGYDRVWRMSYTQLSCVSALCFLDKRGDLELNAAAARIGVNADKKAWESFIKEGVGHGNG